MVPFPMVAIFCTLHSKPATSQFAWHRLMNLANPRKCCKGAILRPIRPGTSIVSWKTRRRSPSTQTGCKPRRACPADGKFLLFTTPHGPQRSPYPRRNAILSGPARWRALQAGMEAGARGDLANMVAHQPNLRHQTVSRYEASGCEQVERAGTTALWIYDSARGLRTRFTSDRESYSGYRLSLMETQLFIGATRFSSPALRLQPQGDMNGGNCR